MAQQNPSLALDCLENLKSTLFEIYGMADENLNKAATRRELKAAIATIFYCLVAQEGRINRIVEFLESHKD